MGPALWCLVSAILLTGGRHPLGQTAKHPREVGLYLALQNPIPTIHTPQCMGLRLEGMGARDNLV